MCVSWFAHDRIEGRCLFENQIAVDQTYQFPFLNTGGGVAKRQ